MLLKSFAYARHLRSNRRIAPSSQTKLLQAVEPRERDFRRVNITRLCCQFTCPALSTSPGMQFASPMNHYHPCTFLVRAFLSIHRRTITLSRSYPVHQTHMRHLDPQTTFWTRYAIQLSRLYTSAEATLQHYYIETTMSDRIRQLGKSRV